MTARDAAAAEVVAQGDVVIDRIMDALRNADTPADRVEAFKVADAMLSGLPDNDDSTAFRAIAAVLVARLWVEMNA
jgi:hypothetical protein